MRACQRSIRVIKSSPSPILVPFLLFPRSRAASLYVCSLQRILNRSLPPTSSLRSSLVHPLLLPPTPRSRMAACHPSLLQQPILWPVPHRHSPAQDSLHSFASASWTESLNSRASIVGCPHSGGRWRIGHAPARRGRRDGRQTRQQVPSSCISRHTSMSTGRKK